jgi:hypothetical protein
MFCEHCRKVGLLKAEVEKDHNSGMILCLGCYSLANPGWSPTPVKGPLSVLPLPLQIGLGYAVSLDSFRGFSAQISFGEVALELTIPHRTLKNFLGMQ